MDIHNQIYLNGAVFMLGLLFGLPYLSKCNIFLYFSISWFIGWGIIALSSIFTVIAGVYVTLPLIVILSSLIVVIFWLANGKAIVGELFWFYSGREKIWTKYLVGLIGSILFIVIASNYGNFFVYTTDSLQIEGMSRMFHKFGHYAELTEFTSSLFITRAPFYITVNNISYMFNVRLFYSFMLVTIFFISLGIWGFWQEEKDKSFYPSILWFLLTLMLFLSNNLLIYHSFYKHTNFTAMAYYLFGIMAVYEYIKKRKNFWFILACFFLGCTGIIRSEMLVFSVIPFCFLAWKRYFPKLKVTLGGLGIYSLVIYPWFCWGFYLLIGNYEVLESISYIKYVGALTAFSFFSMLALTLISRRSSNRKIPILLQIVFFLGILCGIYYLKDNLIFSIEGLIYTMFRGKDMFWGPFWYLAVFGLILYVVFRILPAILKICNIGDSGNTGEFKDKLFLDFIFFVISAFILARIVVYSMPAARVFPYRTHSSNRMLLHIYPVIVYFLGRLGYIYTRRIFNEKNINNNSSF